MNISDTDINNAHMELERTLEILEDIYIEESNNAKMIIGTDDDEEKIKNLNETIHKTSFIPVENTSEITIDTLHETHITNHSQSDSIDEISKTEISTELIIVNIDLETNENPITSITDLTSETSSSNDSPSVPGENTSNVDMDNMHGIGTFIDYSSELLGNHNKIESETEVMTLEDHTRLDDNEEKIKPKIDIKTVYPPTNDISFEGISNQIENYKNTEHETGNDDTAYTSLVMNEVQSELLDKYQDSEIETSKILGCNTDNKSNEEPTQNKIDSLSEMLLSNESRIPIEENKREIDTDATPDTIVINKIQSESLTLNKEVELQFLSEDQLTIDDYLIPVQNTSTMIINIDTVYETQVTVCSQSESVDELEKTDISFESNIYNTDLVTNEENENIDDNTNMTTECSVSNDAFLKSVINTSDIDINIKHEHLVLNDSPAEEIKDLEIQRICGIENLNILIPETNISNGNSILKETTEQKVPIDVDTKTDIPTEDISLNKNPLLPVQKTMEIDILQQTMHTETEIPIDIPLPNDALAVTVENSSEFNRVTTEELLLSTNSSLTCILNNTGSKSKNKLNDIVTTEEIENSEVKNKNAQPNLFCDTVDTNDVDILNNIPKHRKASDEFQLSSDHNLRVKSCDIPESELSVQDVETYATDSFEETFVQSEQTSRNKISMNTVDNENKTTIDDKLYTVNESDLNAILCASSLQEALTLLDSKIKLKFKNNTKKVSSKVKTATYDSSMQLPSSSNSENNFNFTEARDFFKQIEQKSKNN
ncbi:Hypothetical protein CINCED_3A005606 [Cinara cedri]|uniref:Uncharacterized protein n=1 Tax=Cinara cedri TaxID=506608 RepID=A0A5E4NH24_9HEMI|nr:Hypothetical protein CINCED_3A005606 [Cinara cedri]